MTKEDKRLERWTEKVEIINGVEIRYLKPPQNCRTKKASRNLAWQKK